MQLIKGKKEEIEKRAAEIIAQKINEILKTKEKVVLALPGGTSVSGVFTNLKWQTINWKKVHIFMIDERLVPLDSPESNFKLANTYLIDFLIKSSSLPAENVHPFMFDEDAPDSGIDNYEKELIQFGGEYDIILLSAGEDGHIAALFPQHHSIREESQYYLNMEDSPKLPKDRMTSSKKLILKSKTALLLFIGEKKNEALESFLSKEKTVEECPAKLIKDISDSYILKDIQ